MPRKKTQNNALEERTPQKATGVIATELVGRLCGWLDGRGPDADIIISSRVRLARNVRGFNYPNIATSDELTRISSRIENVVHGTTFLKDGFYIRMKNALEWDKRFLVERRLISPQFAEKSVEGVLCTDRDQFLSIMVNEEDHLRLQAIQSGLQIERAWHMVNMLDEELGKGVPYDFSEQFGYLTACPTNTGTGMRASIFVHLPALTIVERMEKVIEEMSPSEITIRGFHGEGTGVQGNIYQISNQLTLGRSDEHIVKRLKMVAEKFVELEREARRDLMRTSSRRVKDIVFRAVAILRSALLLNSFEFIHLLSAIRLGSDLQIIAPTATKTLNELLIIMQPAHLRVRLEDEYDLPENELNDEKRDAYRAERVREYLHL